VNQQKPFQLSLVGGQRGRSSAAGLWGRDPRAWERHSFRRLKTEPSTAPGTDPHSPVQGETFNLFWGETETEGEMK